LSLINNAAPQKKKIKNQTRKLIICQPFDREIERFDGDHLSITAAKDVIVDQVQVC